MSVKVAYPKPPLKQRNWLREIFETLLFVFTVYVLVEMAAPRFMVEGPSMQPTFWDFQRLIISRINYLVGEPEYGDIVVFNAPASKAGDLPLIKRAIGLPGDTIEFRAQVLYRNGVVVDEAYINEPCNANRCPDGIWTLSPNEYFVMGDNRNHSRDSRVFGPITRDAIIGEAFLRYWPLPDFAYLEGIRYNK